MEGTPVSLSHGAVVEGSMSVPGGVTVQIISDPSDVPASHMSSLQAVSTLSKIEEPTGTETLLNIAQPGFITQDQATVLHIDVEQLKALQEASGGGEGSNQLLLVDQSQSGVKQISDVNDSGDQLLLVDESQGGVEPPNSGDEGKGQTISVEVSQSGVKEEGGDELEEERQRVAEDIRHQIRELCAQLADVGEESFLVTVRVSDGAREHLGSIKGDHFCLLRQELLNDFHDFCLGIEEHGNEEEGPEFTEASETIDDDDDVIDENTVEKDEQQEGLDHEESMEVEDHDHVSPANPGSPPLLPVKPRVIVMKKGGHDGKVQVDHEYTIHDRSKKSTAVVTSAVVSSARTVVEPINAEPTTNILFLCDVCKDVFANLKLLKDHKMKVHDEGDHKCTECSRLFTLKKNLERHMIDAHNKDGVNKFVCDTCVMDFVTKDDLENHIAGCHNPELGMKCDICEQTFPDISKLMEHRKLHFDYDCFCTRCWQGFFDSLELETHIQTNCRYKEALYKCDICGKKYTKLHAINKHIDTHPIHAPHVCRMCGRGFDTEKELKNHRIAAHIIRPYRCEFCEKTFKKRESVIDHRRIHLRVKLQSVSVPSVMLNGDTVEEMEAEPLSFECSFCGIILSSQSNYDQHMMGHAEGNEEHRCDHCDKVFFSRSLLIVHCRKEHKIFLSSRPGEDMLDLLACDWEGCNKTFCDRMKWKYHMKYHQARADKIAKGLPLTPQPEECSCPICGKVLKYKSYLKLHMANHSGDKPHQCDICGTSYQSAKRLNDHIRVHKGEKPFKCRVCDKHFSSTSLRNQHMVVHWGSKTYICDICGKGFMSRKHFHDHMRIHNGEQPHKCETCGKDFIYYRSLVRHALTHIDPKERPKPYKCHYCGKEYTEVTGYKHHLRSVHTGETPFQCDICGEAFHRNDKLKRHMRSRHNRRDDKTGGQNVTHIVTTRREAGHGAPVIIKTEQELARQGELQIIQNGGGEGEANELHVDVIQDNSPQVFLIGLGNEGGETTYLQETQVIEGPDGTRYIIAGSGEELQVIESSDVQQLQAGDVVQNDEGGTVTVLEDQQVTYSADQETLATLANMASVAEIADVVQQVE